MISSPSLSGVLITETLQGESTFCTYADLHAKHTKVSMTSQRVEDGCRWDLSVFPYYLYLKSYGHCHLILEQDFHHVEQTYLNQ